MADRFWLSDEQWAVLEQFMPKNQPGARRVDDRHVNSGIIHVLKTGSPWRACPDDFGRTRQSTTASTGVPPGLLARHADGAGCGGLDR
jgi:transposase